MYTLECPFLPLLKGNTAYQYMVSLSVHTGLLWNSWKMHYHPPPNSAAHLQKLICHPLNMILTSPGDIPTPRVCVASSCQTSCLAPACPCLSCLCLSPSLSAVCLPKCLPTCLFVCRLASDCPPPAYLSVSACLMSVRSPSVCVPACCFVCPTAIVFSFRASS